MHERPWQGFVAVAHERQRLCSRKIAEPRVRTLEVLEVAVDDEAMAALSQNTAAASVVGVAANYLKSGAAPGRECRGTAQRNVTPSLGPLLQEHLLACTGHILST